MNCPTHRRLGAAVAPRCTFSRALGWIFFPMLLLTLAGCRHKNNSATYQPPSPLPPASSTRSAGAARPPQSGAGNQGASSRTAPSASAGTTATTPQPTPHGKPVSSEVGLASWYVPTYANAKAADGSIYDPNAMTAANRELPMGSIVRVTNLTNNESVFVRITDHGPFVGYDRIIDLSLAAAKAIGVYRAGVAKVRVEAYAPPQYPGVDPAGKWCVQIGAFPNEADAIKLKNSLIRRYSTSKVTEFAGSTGHWVLIKPLKDDKATANQIADSIHVPVPGALPYIVRLN